MIFLAYSEAPEEPMVNMHVKLVVISLSLGLAGSGAQNTPTRLSNEETAETNQFLNPAYHYESL